MMICNIVDIFCCYFHFQYKTMPVAGGMRFVGKLPLVLAFDELFSIAPYINTPNQ